MRKLCCDKEKLRKILARGKYASTISKKKTLLIMAEDYPGGLRTRHGLENQPKACLSQPPGGMGLEPRCPVWVPGSGGLFGEGDGH